MLTCGIGPGDEVITSTQSFFPTMNMIVKVGTRPVFVDCDLVTRDQVRLKFPNNKMDCKICHNSRVGRDYGFFRRKILN
ncbi:glutamine--scyllo-inositol transaminase domain protein [Janthinobacterium agaricidamnosum NBRC 102515 = DSM 9628]|uniref:Glutamine--scyllo-inositol transaminase domain protein n=1 Tax=Janthinobacterium agaricidamnosum NBRC 102515 = DSM 9628 TaxID=1349767 RepID=W0V2R2_9BURK|nr:glutamine--scyllo-inositol transaminase domain protein [Janthinobacterium agaricidamnosum NBRC 102515 = DSM 9628]